MNLLINFGGNHNAKVVTQQTEKARKDKIKWGEKWIESTHEYTYTQCGTGGVDRSGSADTLWGVSVP
jgi:hypothetical protein